MKYALLLLALFPLQVWPHGEDKPGPHNGFIRMPGAFHTEVLLVNKNQLKVFLLDIDWKNPSVKDSALRITAQEKNKSSATCETKENLYYLCSFPKTMDLTKKGKLLVSSQREGQKGIEVSYDLPLRFKPMDNGHGAH